MGIGLMQQQISNFTRMIENCESAIKQKEEQISELKVLKGRYQTIGEEVSLRNEASKTDLERFGSGSGLLKVVQSYYTGMDNILNGNEFKIAIQDIFDAVTHVSKRIGALEQGIADLRSQIGQYQRQIMYCQEEIRRIESEAEVK